MIETMINRQGKVIGGMIDLVRRNHGLEHATLHVLAERHPGKPMGGLSDIGGFWVMGDFEAEEVTEAAREALERLRTGESKLAVHANCGTNYVASGLLAGLAAGLAMIGTGRRLRDALERLPTAMLLATITLILAQPVGMRLQEQVTTCAEPGRLRLMGVRQVQQGKLITHRVMTGE